MISSVVLTCNNQQTIEKTLQSINFCDEIIIIDDNSTDETKKISQKYTQKIYSHSLKDDFSASRNYGLRKATHEWILFIDSDEIVSSELAQEIKNEINNPDNSDTNGFIIKREDTVLGRKLVHGETSRVQLIRLGRKNTGTWRRPVHEVWDIRGNVKKLHNPIIHYPHSNVAQFISKIDYYSTVNAKYLFNNKVYSGFVSIFIYPIAKFIYNYIVLLGCLDGIEGMIVATMMSFHSFLTRAKLYQLWKSKEKRHNQ